MAFLRYKCTYKRQIETKTMKINNQNIICRIFYDEGNHLDIFMYILFPSRKLYLSFHICKYPQGGQFIYI